MVVLTVENLAFVYANLLSLLRRAATRSCSREPFSVLKKLIVFHTLPASWDRADDFKELLSFAQALFP
jgi:hypothetical protein